MTVKIKNEELLRELVGEAKEFPRYTTQIINLASQNSQGTRPKVVGQLTELINECPEKTYEGWKKWYLQKYPNSIDKATERIADMVNKLQDAITKVDKNLIREWVEDLVLEKTFVGLRFQEAVLKKAAEIKETDYRFSSPKEESKGIDGFVGEIPVSIKPMTYKTKKSLRENIDAKMIFYEKKKDGLVVDFSEVIDE